MNTNQTTSHTIDLIASAEKATCLLASATQDPQAQHVFMRELGQSELSHFGWFYLLTTLLSLKDYAQAEQLPANVASASTPQTLAATIGMEALCEAFRKTMLPIMQDAISAGHEDTHLECLEKVQLCVQRFHASAALLGKLGVYVSTQ